MSSKDGFHVRDNDDDGYASSDGYDDDPSDMSDIDGFESDWAEDVSHTIADARDDKEDYEDYDSKKQDVDEHVDVNYQTSLCLTKGFNKTYAINPKHTTKKQKRVTFNEDKTTIHEFNPDEPIQLETQSCQSDLDEKGSSTKRKSSEPLISSILKRTKKS